MKSISYYESFIRDLVDIQREVAVNFSANERMAIQNAIGQVLILAQKQIDELKNEH